MAELPVNLTLRLERWQADGLRLIAEREDRTVSQIVRQTVSERVLHAISEADR